MSSRVRSTLSEKVASELSRGTPGLLLTVDEGGYPHTAFTWIVAVAIDRLRFGADHGGTTLANLERSGVASVQVILQEGQPYLIKGSASLATMHVRSAPFKIALMEMAINHVRDQSWVGVNVRPLQYEWAPREQEKMLEMQLAIYREMREWQG